MAARFFLFIMLCWSAHCVACHPRPTGQLPASAVPPIRAAPAPDPPAAGTLTPCRDHADCKPGLFCRDRGDNVRLCMGHGARGAYCTDTIDCREPLFCRRHRGKLRLCM